MAYTLTHDESIPRGLRRVAREEIDSAIAQLRVKQSSKRDAAVHEARKSIKKLRGVVRLLTPTLGKEGDRENAILRDAGHTLSEVRDAAALIETVDLLGKKYSDDAAVTNLAAVRSSLVKRRNEARSRADSSSGAEQSILALRGLRKRLNKWEIGAEFSLIAPGLKKTYKRGRHALARAEKHGTPEKLHDLRKRVKDYWYQVRLLEVIWPNSEECPEKALREVQEWLGDAHNLAVLRDVGATRIDGVVHLIDDFEKDLRQRSVAAAKGLYHEKPGAHVRKLAELWAVKHDETHRKSANAAADPSVQATSAA